MENSKSLRKNINEGKTWYTTITIRYVMKNDLKTCRIIFLALEVVLAVMNRLLNPPNDSRPEKVLCVVIAAQYAQDDSLLEKSKHTAVCM